MKTWSFLHNLFWGMLVYLQYFILLIPFTRFCMPAVSVSSGRKLPPIYWNHSNSLFDTSTPNSVTVNTWDSIDIHCPHYPNNTNPSLWEYYVLYLVSEVEYNTCRLHDPNLSMMIINCSNPNINDLFFTLLIDPFGGIPNTPDFEEGNTYYIITTSNATLGTLSNQVDGACHYLNMRLKIHICCSNNASSTSISTGSPPSSTGHQIHTTRTTRTTTQPTTTRRSTTSTTTPAPTTTISTTTTNYPGGRPSDPGDNIIIVTGDRNNGVINSARTLQPSWTTIVLYTVTLTLYTRLLR